jgi:TolB protein
MNIKGKLVFSSGKTGDYDIWTLDLVSKEIKQLTSGPHWNDCPKWSPDGKKIIFISNRTGTPEIWLMNEDGSNQIRVTNTERWHNTPDWSPDGKKIVFCANYDGNIDIYTMNIDGSELKQITDYKGMDFNPQFSPDGRKIIFASQRSGNDDIWTYDLEIKEFKQLTTYNARDYSPTFSPDGSLIAFVCGEFTLSGEENLEIYLMDKDGQNRRRITRNLGTDRYAAWSPDGKFLIYTSAHPRSATERLLIIDIEKMKTSKVDFDCQPLDYEIDAEPKSIFIFELIPAIRDKSAFRDFVRKTYPDTYFGTERFPDWKF